MDRLKKFAILHTGKLFALGAGLILLPGFFEILTGVPVKPEPWIGAVCIFGNVLCGAGIFYWRQSTSPSDNEDS